jgi:DNA-directed RNA polymerases I, II, and III subunit RPABC3
MADSQLFEEVFNVTGLDNKKYDRCTRITGTSEDSNTVMTLDINHELWPIQVGDRIQMLLATTLNLDGTKDERGWREPLPGEEDLSAMYDYVCHGKVYRFTEGDAESM